MMKTELPRIAVIVFMFAAVSGIAAPAGAKQFRFSSTVERERPQLNEETRRLISAYRRNPTEENFAALNTVSKNGG